MGLPCVGPYNKHIFQIIRIGHFMDFRPGEPLGFTFLVFSTLQLFDNKQIIKTVKVKAIF